MNDINDGFGDDPGPEVTESIEAPNFTEKDQEDLAKLLEDNPTIEYHSVLEVWQSILDSADRPDNRHMTPKWAMAIIGQYVGIGFGDLRTYVDGYFELLAEIQAALEDVIKGDDDAFAVTSATEDAEQNRENFISVLREWQLLLLTREFQWDASDPDAAVQLAVLSEIQKVLFGNTGLTGHLEAIKLEFTEEDQENMAEALEARRDELMGAK